MNESLHCINHPRVETYLRCNRCGAPICPKCAVQTEVGYRCPDCIKRQQQKFYTGFRPVHYLISGAVALLLGLIGGWLVPSLGWFSILLGPLVGLGVAEAAHAAIGRRRGPHTWLVVAGCVLIGGTVWLVPNLTSLVRDVIGESPLFVNWVGIIVWRMVYLFGSVGTAAARLRPPGH